MTLMALVAGAQIASAQLPADQDRGQNRSAVDGVVEIAGGRLQLSLANADSAGSVSGEARISLGAADKQVEVARIDFTLAPQESRVFPIDARGAEGDNYTLSIHKRTGALILLKNAAIKRGAITSTVAPPRAPAIPAPAKTATTVVKNTTAVKELTVKARLAPARPGQSGAGEIKVPALARPVPPPVSEIKSTAAQNSNSQQVPETEAPAPERPGVALPRTPPSAKAKRRIQRRANNKSQAVQQQRPPQSVESPVSMEAPISDEPEAVALCFDIAAPTPIINASLSVSANDFKERQAVTVQGTANVEFKLPDDFNEPKVNYTLTDASGKTLITGEIDFEALRMEDSVRISEVKVDKESYTPGQSAQIVVTLEGRSPYGYLLEVTAKDENGSPLLSDSRKGVYSNGKSIQEFKVEIPAEVKGIVAVEFKAFGKLTKKLFDSGTRDLIINDTQNDKSEDRGLRIEDRR
jgi:hypothetical protein